jgi:hypothetical protein
MPVEMFKCEQCGRQFHWRSEIAGKKAKCGCGAVLTVPMSIEDEIFDFAPSEPVPMPTNAMRNRPVVASVPPARTPLQYDRHEPSARSDFDSFYSKPRDFYFPTAALAIGFIALLIWAISSGASGAGLFLFTGYVTIATLIKTAVMIGAAFVIAPMAGVSFGGVWTAILKLAAIVVVTDAAMFWLQEIMVATGAVSPSGRSPRGTMLVNLLLAGTIIAILLKIFFDMDRDEVGMIATPLAILNRVLNFVMMLVLLGIVAALQAPPTTPAPATPTAAPTTATPTLPPAPPQVSQADTAIADAIKVKAHIEEALGYYERSLGKRTHRDFVRELYGLGARKVYFRKDLKTTVGPVGVIVELPEASDQRAAILKRIISFIETNKLSSDPSQLRERSQRFVDFALPEGEKTQGR